MDWGIEFQKYYYKKFKTFLKLMVIDAIFNCA